MKSRGAQPPALVPWRVRLVGLVLLAMLAVVLWRIVSLQVLDTERGYRFLQDQGAARTLRTETIPAHRGIISDRHGSSLAVSTPVQSLWVNPRELVDELHDWQALAQRLGMPATELQQMVTANSERSFLYLRRRIAPAEAERVLALGIRGVYAQQEYQRFYPAAEVVSQLVGVTDIDDRGQEGIELAYDDWLRGEDGAKQVLKDRYGAIIRDVKSLRAARPGRDLTLSIDLRLQYLAYRELKRAVQDNQAVSGSMVLLDVHSGEVLALVNQPSYNPNRRSDLQPAMMRNRAITDLYEPGSTVKPLTVLAALESGQYDVDSMIDTSPGYLRVGRKTFVDHRDYGVLDLTGVLMHSSQVGVTKIALAIDPEVVRELFAGAGFGESAATGFPGESLGVLPRREAWHPLARANFAFGYGLSATPLQLARVYATLATDGVKPPLTLLRRDAPVPSERVFDAQHVGEIRRMLETVTTEAGTGTLAAIPGYRVAGKTGTVHKVGEAGYDPDRYVSLFAGFAPATAPRLAAVVVINEPRGGRYYGGEVSAPVFSRVVGHALRMLNVRPDDLSGLAGAVTDDGPGRA